MAKLYEILLRKIGWLDEEKPAATEEQKIYNPIGAKIGGSITIDSLDYRGLNFFVKEIREYSVSMGGKNHRFVDYILLARPLNKPDMWVRLRLVPDKNSATRLTHKAMVLHLYDEFEYSEDFKKGVLEDPSKKFVVDDDKNDADASNDTHDEYWRVNDVGISYNAKYLSMTDENNDGKVSQDELGRGSLDFWDYSRLTDIDGVELEQYMFVEMDNKSGWFQIWQGTQVSPERVDAI
jgi:hypothetical protein